MSSTKTNRKMGIIVAFIVSVVLLITLTCLVPRADSRSVIADEDTAMLSTEALSNDAYNLLLHAFADEGNGSLMSYFPDYYSGAYINTERHLVILTNNANEFDLKRITEICKNNDISFQTAKHSYNELIKIKDNIFERCKEIIKNDSYTNTTFSVSIRDNENKVYVSASNPEDIQLREYLTQDLKPAKNDYDAGVVVFEKVEKPITAYYSLYPGYNIYANEQGSVAYKAQITYQGQTKTGFITAGHVTFGENAYYNGWGSGKVGNLIVEQINGSADAAFCELTAGNTFTNIVSARNITPGLYVIPAPGSTVYKIGSATGTTTGTIISNVASVTELLHGQYVNFTNMIQTTNSAAGGDSGGLLYSISGTASRVAGILTGGNGTYTYFTDAALLPWTVWPCN